MTEKFSDSTLVIIYGRVLKRHHYTLIFVTLENHNYNKYKIKNSMFHVLTLYLYPCFHH
jgi:hypothetical protein